MNSKQRVSMLVGCAALGLSGCVAAVIPVAASGLISGTRLRHHRQPRIAKQARATPVAQAGSSAPSTVASVPVLPADLSTMKMGQTYRGTLPSPTGSTAMIATPAKTTTPATPPVTVATTAPATGPVHSTASTWSDVMHFAATSSLHQPADSALLAKGSTTASPHWLPCGNKPVAVLVTLPAAGTTTFFDASKDNLGAMETMGVTLLFASDQPTPVVARQLGLLAAGGVKMPVAGSTLFAIRAGQEAETRATVGARYCVVALVGSHAADFPNALLPGTSGASPGWFLIR